MQEYRAPQYVGGGVDIIFSINDLVDIRIDPYFFQPFKQIVNYPNGGFGYSEIFDQGTLMAGGSVIFHSPVGPLRITTNYFPRQEQPFLTQVSFGYVLFNKRAIR
jgi:NTE family protein